MLTGAFLFLLDSVATAFTAVLLLRFHMQFTRAAFNNPVSQFAIALTDFIVKPARRVIPGLWGMDLATLVVAWGVQALLLLIVLGISGRLADANAAMFLILALYALLELAKIALWMVIFLQFMLFIVSFVNPYSPYMGLLDTLNRPFTRVIRRYLPPIGNIDLSPMVVVLICMVLLQFILPGLAAMLRPGAM